MPEGEDLNYEAIVKIAEMLSFDELTELAPLLSLPARMRLQQYLKEKQNQNRRANINESDTPTTRDLGASYNTLPATIIVEPNEHKANDQHHKSVPLDGPGRQINLVKLHATGAVGEVYVAFDDQLSREVALKRIRKDLPMSKPRFERFVREAEITARLQHPCIVPVYDFQMVGQDAHYTMPLVSGSNLASLIRETHEKATANSGAALMSMLRPLLVHFIAVCNAIDYAHTQNVLHRDIKPENVMIGTQGQTIVLDWGCAKETEGESDVVEKYTIEDPELAAILGVEVDPGRTLAGTVMGTLEFMSPEQATGDISSIGKPSDIFGLGATLFNLLTNERSLELPLENRDLNQAIQAVRQGKHRRVDQVSSLVPKPLVEICHQAMAFAPEDRYRSAGELADDIDAFLAGEPVSVYSEPLFDRAIRFGKRHRTAFTTLLGMLLVGFFSLALITIRINRERSKLAVANNQLEEVNLQREQRLHQMEMLQASEASSEPGGFGRMVELVERWNTPERLAFTGWEWQHLSGLEKQELWTAKTNSTTNRIVFTKDQSVGRVFDYDQRQMFTIDPLGQRITGQKSLPKGVTCADFNSDQSLFALGFETGKVVVFNTADGSTTAEFKGLATAVNDVRWNVGGDYLAASDSSGKLLVWQWFERKVVASSSGVLNMPRKLLLSWSFDGKRLCWTTGKTIRELDVESGKQQTIAEDDWILNPCWSHEGKLLAWIGPNNVIVVKDPQANTRTEFEGHQLFVETISWHPHLHFLLSSSADGSMRIWNIDDEVQIRQLLGHRDAVFAGAWNHDGSRILSGGLPDDGLRLWDASTVGKSEFDRELQEKPAISFHPTESAIATASGSDIRIIDTDGQSKLLENVLDGKQIRGLAFDPTGSEIACVSVAGRIWTIDAQTGKRIHVFDKGSKQTFFPEPTPKSIAWSPDGKFLAGIGSRGKLRIWELASGKDLTPTLEKKTGRPLVIAWRHSSADDNEKGNGTARASDQALAIAGTGEQVLVVQPSQGKVVTHLTQYGWKTGLDWSPDGTRIAVSDRRSVRILDAESSTEIGFCDGPTAMVRDLSWSSSQQRIAAIADDGTICIWDDDSLAFCGKFRLHKRIPYTVCWSPDGKHLASTAKHGRLELQTISPQTVASEE